MGYPVPPPRPPRNATDVAVSVVVLVLTGLLVVASGFFGVFVLAFLDHCPPESCRVDGAVTAVMSGVGLAALAGAIGLVATIVRLSTRKTAWPFAVVTLGVCALAVLAGGVAFSLAVGG
jgi:hypothetical protein